MRRIPDKAQALLVPCALWLALWGGLNTSLERLFNFANLSDLLHGLRAPLPFIAGGVATLICLRHRLPLWDPLSPLGLLGFYGAIGAIASVSLSPSPVIALHWTCAYLGVLPVLRVWWFSDDPLSSLKLLLNITWILIGIIGTAMALMALWTTIPLKKISFYWILTLLPSVGGMPMVRASGIARFAAVLGLVALSRLVHAHPLKHPLFWTVVFVVSVGVLWICQSVGAVLAFAVAASVVLVCRRNARLLLAGLIVAGIIAVSVSGPLRAYVMREKTAASLLSGRPAIWASGMELIKDSPVLGLGFQADRLFLEAPYKNHISNAFIHAFAQAGIAGGLPFVAAWIAVWGLLAHLLRRVQGAERPFLIEVAAVLTFMTVRAVFESSGAFYGVDWLLLAALFAYLQAAAGRTGTRSVLAAQPGPVLAPP